MRPAAVVPGARSSVAHKVSVFALVVVINVRVGESSVATGVTFEAGLAVAGSVESGSDDSVDALPAHAAAAKVTVQIAIKRAARPVRIAT